MFSGGTFFNIVRNQIIIFSDGGEMYLMPYIWTAYERIRYEKLVSVLRIRSELILLDFKAFNLIFTFKNILLLWRNTKFW